MCSDYDKCGSRFHAIADIDACWPGPGFGDEFVMSKIQVPVDVRVEILSRCPSSIRNVIAENTPGTQPRFVPGSSQPSDYYKHNRR
jgi:hypothetical protein